MVHIKRMTMKGFKSFARETVIELDQYMNVIVGPNGSGKSLEYSSRVQLSDGKIIKIGELVESQLNNRNEIKNLDDGIYVNGDDSIKILSLNKFTGKQEIKPISKFIKRDGEIIYEITTSSGRLVKATGCHPVMTFVNSEIKSVLLKDLKQGGLIATPRKMNILSNKSLDNRISRLLGYLIGDGYIAKDRIEFINKDIEIINDFKNIVKEVYKVDFNIYQERIKNNVTKLIIRDKNTVKTIKDLFIKNYSGSITSIKKKIPELIIESDNQSISNILAGLYDTDGSIRKDIAVIEYCTKNKELAYQIQGLLLRFGILSKIKKRKSSAKNTIKKIKRDYYYIYISGIDNIKNFYYNIPIKINYKIDTLKTHLDKNILSNPNIDLLPREINIYIKELARLLGIKYKLLRKDSPSLAAYIENRCNPSRYGLSHVISVFENRLCELNNTFSSINHEQINLVKCMDTLNLSSREVSQRLGLHSTIIRNQWANNKFNAKEENLNNFYNLINETFELRFVRINELMILLKNLANSDIYWDEIVSIKKLQKEKYVYDLTIEDNHNFIANNIFVHNSNVTDALCFVLGRLSIKSIRAAKASNLIFSGNKEYKSANDAYVEILLDNSDKTFALDDEEISVRRIVKKNGQSVYKINGNTKTRQEVIELLSQAGIDPHGFNIILQGEIQKFVKMSADERRKVIEEVAGISVYEMRKEKSLKELDRTHEKLRQINAVLRERTNYLRNLENEREQALRFKKLESTVKKCKASIIQKNINEKDKDLKEVLRRVDTRKKEIEKKNEKSEKIHNEILIQNEKINNITKTISDTSGLEQDSLNTEINQLKQDIAGMIARIENYENQLNELKRRKESLLNSKDTMSNQIETMKKETGKNTKKDLEEKKKKLTELEELKRKFYIIKSNLSSVENSIEDKKREISRLNNESNFILTQIENTEKEINIKGTLENHKEKLLFLRKELTDSEKKITELQSSNLDKEKSLSREEHIITENEKIKTQVGKLDTCPLCKTKITEKHIKEVIDKSNKKIDNANLIIHELKDQIDKNQKEIIKLKEKINDNNLEINNREKAIIKLETINEKKAQLKRNNETIQVLENELKNLQDKRKDLDKKYSTIKISDESYENLKLEVNELQRTEERNLGLEITTKQRELDRIDVAIKQNKRDYDEISEELTDLKDNLSEKENIVAKKEEQADKLKQKFQKMYDEKNKLQDNVRQLETDMLKQQNDKRILENDINNMMITKAQVTAKIETFKSDMIEYEGVEILNLSIDRLQEKLRSSEHSLARIGNVNLRALEVYEGIKEEYDKIKAKVDQLDNEKESILKVIAQIDRKKKKAFIDTLKDINDLFSQNFSQLSSKGIVSLIAQNKQDIFEGGLTINVNVGGGKKFDITSLSGGEQTLVALSLIFSIQEFRPYCFYIFDEIDAALDRRNSEKLAYLLKKHMKKGQYIVITHNDSIISESSNILYGVSMQEGISKVLSIKI